MMPTVLLVTGTCGVGKTTTSRAWAEARGGAHIRGDDIYLWIRSKSVRRANDHQNEAVAQIAAAGAETFLAHGLDVAIDFVWKPPILRFFSDRLSGRASVRMVWLCCEPDENRRRDAQREPGSVMGERVHQLQAELDAITDWPAELLVIESTGRSVEDVLSEIDRI